MPIKFGLGPRVESLVIAGLIKWRLCEKMKQAIDLIKTSLSALYPAGEIDGIIRLIFDRLCGYSVTDMLLNRDKTLAPELHEKIAEMVARLKQREPIQYVLGSAYFGDLTMQVGKGVLIPRPETAEMVQRIIVECGAVDGAVADICTGSGCIAIALAHAWPQAQVEGWDISTDALAYARRNAVDNKVNVLWKECDVLSYEPVHAPRYAVMVSNPPYILDSERESMDDNVLLYEPHNALFVPDSDPLLFYRIIARIARRELLPGGKLYFEINSLMGDACVALLQECGFDEVTLCEDYRGAARVVKGVNR